MGLRLFNTMGRSVQDFIPINEGKVGFYGCGPTVYNYAHIGNLKTYIFEDFLKRTLTYLGYKVKHVMNITDVGHLTDDADDGEDKMAKSAREKGQSVYEIADFYTKAFFNDIDRLNIIRPTISCKATEHIADMIALVKTLEERGYTYEAGGNIYFSIDKFPDYGKLALLDRQNLQAGARIEVDGNKRNPYDFVLWFTKSKFENHAMIWDSPWGKGYPGWHLECSAMSMKYLGRHFDIHCGGIDHINIHHTNEIAQSEAATGEKWVNYWLHGEFLVMNKAKMAKSAGNFLTLDTLVEKGYDPLDYRYFCLGGHYRSQLNFSFESMDSAKKARTNLKSKVQELMSKTKCADRNSLSDAAKQYIASFTADISDDLNSPRALAEVWTLLKDNGISDSEKLYLLLDFDKVLGLRLDVPEKPAETVAEDIPAEVLELVESRKAARKNKDFAEADRCRDRIKELGYDIKDTPQGTICKKL
ncbi:MAG: cysteine--tRNA ligase [Spirochaetia bacterium]|nr:cysteine--tRNA ligase [Spirochaetia bacterium]